jgi:hypothetical protein
MPFGAPSTPSSPTGLRAVRFNPTGSSSKAHANALHLPARETEFCGLRLAGALRRSTGLNRRNPDRRPLFAATNHCNYCGFSPPGNHAALADWLVGLRGFEPMAIAGALELFLSSSSQCPQAVRLWDPAGQDGLSRNPSVTCRQGSPPRPTTSHGGTGVEGDMR